MVSVEDVRNFLKELPEQYVSDETINMQIRIAEFLVNKEKSKLASDDDVSQAVLLVASHLTLCAYAAEIERSLGVVSPALNALIDRMKDYADKALSYVRRGETVRVPVAVISDSLYDYIRGGN